MNTYEYELQVRDQHIESLRQQLDDSVPLDAFAAAQKQLAEREQELAEARAALTEAVGWNWIDGDVPLHICDMVDNALLLKTKQEGEA